MIGQRGLTNQLVRILQSAAEPIYALDGERRIVFCNAACAEWLGMPSESLVGQICRYGAEPESSREAQVVAALCPSPQVLNHGGGSCVVSAPRARGEPPAERTFACFPLHDTDRELRGVLLVAVDSAASPSSVAEPLSISSALHSAVQRFRHEQAGRFAAPRLIGDSPGMRRVRAQMAVAGAVAANVVIAGPPGCGRAATARAIHAASASVVPGRLVPLACKLLGPDLVRTTLSALAAARREPVDQRPGTVLIEDADLLTPELQQLFGEWLLTAGSWLRAIATCRHPLAELVREGQCRADLAAALGTLTVEIPPLAERLDDLPALAQALVEEQNARNTKQLAGFSAEALDRLAAHSWSRDVEELADVVRQAFARAAGPEIVVADLPERVHLAAEAAAHSRDADERIVLDDYLLDIERELFRRAMRRAKGNKSLAAKLLGTTRPKLYRRLVQLGFESPTAGPAAED